MMHELKEWENPTCPTCAGHWLESRPHRVRWVRMHAHTWRNQSVLKHVRSNETAIVLRTCRSRPYSAMSIGYVLCEWRRCLYFAVSLGWIHFNHWRTSAVSTVDKYLHSNASDHCFTPIPCQSFAANSWSMLLHTAAAGSEHSADFAKKTATKTNLQFDAVWSVCISFFWVGVWPIISFTVIIYEFLS